MEDSRHRKEIEHTRLSIRLQKR